MNSLLLNLRFFALMFHWHNGYEVNKFIHYFKHLILHYSS